jgi:hypothetical protein
MAQQKRCGAAMMALETDQFGVNHAELGAVVLNKWQLSTVMSRVVLCHHVPDLAAIEDRETRELTAIVNVASEFPLLLGIFGPFDEEVDLSRLPGAQYLDLDADRLEDLLRQFRNVFEENREDFLG